MPTEIDQSRLPAAQGSVATPTTDAGSSQPPSSGAGNPPAASAVDDAERRRRTEEGRRLKALEDIVITQQQQLSVMGAAQSEREKREQQAILDSLLPEERLERQIGMLGERIDAMQSRATQPVARTEDPVVYQQRRMQEIIDEVNREFPGADITAEERDALVQRGAVSLETPESYAHDLRLIAAANTRGKPPPTPAQNGQPQGGVGGGQGGTMPQGNTEESIDELVERRATEKSDEYLRQFGINRPNSARASVPAGPPTSDSYRTLASGFGSNMSPRQRRAAIEKLRNQR